MNGNFYLRGATVLHIEDGTGWYWLGGAKVQRWSPLCWRTTWPVPLPADVLVSPFDDELPDLPVCQRCATIARRRIEVLSAIVDRRRP